MECGSSQVCAFLFYEGLQNGRRFSSEREPSLVVSSKLGLSSGVSILSPFSILFISNSMNLSECFFFQALIPAHAKGYGRKDIQENLMLSKFLYHR